MKVDMNPRAVTIRLKQTSKSLRRGQIFIIDKLETNYNKALVTSWTASLQEINRLARKKKVEVIFCIICE